MPGGSGEGVRGGKCGPLLPHGMIWKQSWLDGTTMIWKEGQGDRGKKQGVTRFMMAKPHMMIVIVTKYLLVSYTFHGICSDKTLCIYSYLI